MPPVLEQRAVPALVGEPVEQRGIVGAEPGEERQVVRAHEHVHGVDLQEPEALDGPEDVGGPGPRRRARVAEPLRGQRDAPRLRGGQRLDGGQLRPAGAASAFPAASALRPPRQRCAWRISAAQRSSSGSTSSALAGGRLKTMRATPASP